VLKSLGRVGTGVAVLAIVCFGQVRAPGRTRTNSSGRGSTAAADPNAPKGVYPTTRGVLKSISGSQLLLELDDEHEMKFRITRKTKIFSQDKQGTQEIKTSSLHPGQTVSIDMQSALDGSVEAVRVTLESPRESPEPPKEPKEAPKQ